MLPLTEDAWAQSAEWLVIWYLKNEFEIIGGTLRGSESNYENKWKDETIKIRNFKMINGEVFALFLMRELITLILVWDKRMTILFGKSEGTAWAGPSEPPIAWIDPQWTTFRHWIWNMSENFWYLFENNGEFGDHCYGNPDLTIQDTGWVQGVIWFYSLEESDCSFGTKSDEEWSSNDNVEKIFPASAEENNQRGQNSFKRK